MLSFKQVESNYSKKEPCEQGCSWTIKFSHCFNFGYCKYGLYHYFFNSNSKWLWIVNAVHTKKKNLWSEQHLILF